MKNVLKNITAGDFNRRFPVGSKLRYFPVVGIPDFEIVTTRSEAWSLRGNPFVNVEERAYGGLSVRRMSPLEVKS